MGLDVRMRTLATKISVDFLRGEPVNVKVLAECGGSPSFGRGGVVVLDTGLHSLTKGVHQPKDFEGKVDARRCLHRRWSSVLRRPRSIHSVAVSVGFGQVGSVVFHGCGVSVLSRRRLVHCEWWVQ